MRLLSCLLKSRQIPTIAGKPLLIRNIARLILGVNGTAFTEGLHCSGPVDTAEAAEDSFVAAETATVHLTPHEEDLTELPADAKIACEPPPLDHEGKADEFFETCTHLDEEAEHPGWRPSFADEWRKLVDVTEPLPSWPQGKLARASPSLHGNCATFLDECSEKSLASRSRVLSDWIEITGGGVAEEAQELQPGLLEAWRLLKVALGDLGVDRTEAGVKKRIEVRSANCCTTQSV